MEASLLSLLSSLEAGTASFQYWTWDRGGAGMEVSSLSLLSPLKPGRLHSNIDDGIAGGTEGKRPRFSCLSCSEPGRLRSDARTFFPALILCCSLTDPGLEGFSIAGSYTCPRARLPSFRKQAQMVTRSGCKPKLLLFEPRPGDTHGGRKAPGAMREDQLRSNRSSPHAGGAWGDECGSVWDVLLTSRDLRIPGRGRPPVAP